MVSSISRNYISGLSSGLDTQALIEQTIKAESFAKFNLERKRNTLTYKQEMLREVNLALHNLQTKASDLSLTKTFTTKKVNSSDEKLVAAKATTAAAVGSYTIKVKQIATASSVSSSSKLTGAMQNGHLLTSSNKIGGISTKLSTLGVANDAGQDFAGLNVTMFANNGSQHNLSIQNVSKDDSIESALHKINSQIAADSNFKGKVVASYDEKNNQIKFNMLDNAAQSVSFADESDDGLVKNLFGTAVVSVNGSTPAVNSNANIRSGLNTLRSDLGLEGKFTVSKGGTNVTIDLDTMAEDATMEDIINAMNSQLGQAGGAFSYTGASTSDPANLTAAFRYNDTTGKLELVNTDSTDSQQLTVLDDETNGNFAAKLFGNASVTSSVSADDSKPLAEKFFATKITNGKFTVDGVQINVNADTDTLSDVLSRISSLTNVRASYDSATDTISFTRKDGSTAAIGVGSATDSSNFLRATGMISGAQDGATLTGSRAISGVNTSAGLENAGFATPVTTGKFTINGVEFEIKNTSSTTIDSIIDMINNNEEVGVNAQYDPTSGKFILSSKETGNQSIAIGASGDTSNFLSAMGLTSAVQDIGQNAIYSIDGLYGGADQVSQSNIIADAVEGLTFELKNVTVGSGETINVSVDTESSMTALKEFIDAYNEVTELVYGHLTAEPNKELSALSDEEIDSLDDATLNSYLDAYKVGLLRGDSTLRTIRSQMRMAMSAVVKGLGGDFNSLSDLGITTGVIGSSYTETMVGKISITDEDKLKKALENNPNEVAALFNSNDDGKVGIARGLRDVLNSFTSSTGILTKRVGRSDSSVTSQMDLQVKSLNEQIASQRARLAMREEALLKQFTALESAMSEYQSQSNSFASMLMQGSQ
jgi:flagellar hook-associated protein 2